MDVVHNKNKTFDIVGLDARQAYALTILLGQTNGNYLYKLWELLDNVLPDRGYLGVALGTIDLNSVKSEDIDSQLRQLGFLGAPANTHVPMRHSNGQFKKKKWVARFYYPRHGSNFSCAGKRTLITEYPGKSKSPNLKGENNSSLIRGWDVDRDEYRMFRVDKIIGGINWHREYTD